MMKKLAMMVALAAMVAAPGIASAATNHPDQTNIQNSSNLVVQGGQVIVHPAGNTSVRFHLTPAGIEIVRTGASYIDNRTIGASTRFRTSGSTDRDTLNLVLEPDGDAIFAAQVIVGTTMSAAVVEIRGAGNDLAESFMVNNPIDHVEAGMVVSIDPKNPGEMVLANSAYDSKVAGVINGAGGLHAGIHLGDTHAADSGYRQVALTGRVYVKADPSNGVITPGDMLTTSMVPGHAMKVTDHAKAQGAIIGKAMTPVNAETGLVLVLVSLQ